jgi:hypothetical protein
MRWLGIISVLAIAGSIIAMPHKSLADDFTVYSVYNALDLGNPGEKPVKDFYVNMGRSHGVREGTILEVLRRTPTYDAVSEKLYKEVTFPIARLKVIHVEPTAAIARLEKMLPEEKTPAVNPRAVMVGDLVQIAGASE